MTGTSPGFEESIWNSVDLYIVCRLQAIAAMPRFTQWVVTMACGSVINRQPEVTRARAFMSIVCGSACHTRKTLNVEAE